MLLTLLCSTAASFLPQDVGDRIAATCARSGGVARATVLGESRGGRPIHIVTLAADGPIAETERPAVLIVAGMDGTHRLGTDLALDQLDRLVDGVVGEDTATRALLRDRILHVVPALNPDGLALGRTGNAASIDLDRDGRQDEDAPRDVDGDGLVAQMRWEDPDGLWLLDAVDPRILRKANPQEGERGTHSLEIEAADTDGDDDRGEDDAQGVAVHRNFAHHFDEFDRRTGPFPMSEPETRALADFVYSHRNIAMAFVWDTDDNLLATPDEDEPRPRIQLDGMLADDVPIYDEAGARYRELTGRSGSSSARMDGSVWSWLHFQVGVPTFASDVWRVPAGSGEGDDETSDDQARLAHCDAVGAGFVAWHTFEHPQLGTVELGGFVQARDADLAPTGAARAELFAAHHEFFLEQAARGPRIHIRSFTATALDGGAHRIEATIVNDGDWPSATATAQRSRRFSSPRLRLVLSRGAKLVAGLTRSRTDTLPALGGKHEASWIVTGPAGGTVRLELSCDPVGSDHKEVTL